MDALTTINQNLDVVALMKHYDFDKVQTEGNTFRACCKIHGGNNPTSFVINVDTGLWYCHTGNCGGGDAYTLVQKLEGCDFKTSVKILASMFGIDLANLEITERKASYLNEMRTFIDIMKARKRKTLEPFALDVPIKEVRKFRSFEPETLEYFKLGYVEEVGLQKTNGDPYTLYNRLVIPIIVNDVQVGVSLRKTRAKDYPKWSHQPRNIKTGNLLYNIDCTQGESRIAVCEGPLDVWAFHEIGVPAVATFGSNVTDEQYKLLMRTGADLVFAYDGDEAGRDAFYKARDMFKYKANVETIIFDEGEDPESISREELGEKYANRRKRMP